MLFQREFSFFSRHVLITFILALCIISLLWFQLPSKALFRYPEPPSGRIYDVYIQGSLEQEAEASAAEESNRQPGAFDSPTNDTDSGDSKLLRPSANFSTSAVGLPFEIYDPYPNYNSKASNEESHGTHFACEGPRGVDVNGNADDMLGAYRLPSDASNPQPIFGSYKDTGLGSGYCFERHARNRAYGDEDIPGDRLNNKPQPRKVQWEKVNWGRLQRDCYNRNRGRFRESIAPPSMFRFPTHDDVRQVNETLILPDPAANSERQSYRRWFSDSKKYKARNAVLLRTYDKKKYTPDNMYHIRSMITELSLHSGAEYEVFLLVQIIDLNRHIFSDPAVYQKALDDFVPHEFHNISILFNVPLLEAWYPKAGKHDPNNSQQVHMSQPVQLFSLLRPDFDMYWQLELDVRYTGHHYHHLEAIRQWSQKQPRKLQWERAAYFYSPFIHRTWKNFSAKIRETTKGGGFWGAVTTTGIAPVGPKPPTKSAEEDDFEWGMGEPADMINIMPIVDPVATHMMFRDVVDNYPDGKKTPRRTAPITPLIATSKRLVRAMHHGQVTLGTHMMPELFPESTAFQHGLKTVTFPEPVYLDISDKGPEELESIFNDQTEASIWNGGSPHGKLVQHANYWWSSGIRPEFSNVLYRRWLGIDFEGKKTDEQGLCLPAMSLHPIKEL